MPVDIPIDEVKAITLKVSPTYHLDRVESVTLKSFRKVVGYDTFNSILKKDRDEKKEHIFLDDGACECCDPEKINVMMQIQRVRSYLNSAVSAMNMLEFWIDEVEERHHKLHPLSQFFFHY